MEDLAQISLNVPPYWLKVLQKHLSYLLSYLLFLSESKTGNGCYKSFKYYIEFDD